MASVHIRLEDGSETDVDDSTLVRTDGVIDNDDEHTTWVEYRFPDRPDLIVHRSVHVTLKRLPPGMEAVVAKLGE